MITSAAAPRQPRVPRLVRTGLGVVATMVVLAVAAQLLPSQRGSSPAAISQPAQVGGPAIDAAAAGPDAPSATAADLERIRADVAFWSARASARPTDFISAGEWAHAEIELARATGDLAAWQRAEAAAGLALDVNPEHLPAFGARGSALLALHRFDDARTLARAVLADRPADALALATLGDASLDLGDYPAARSAYDALDEAMRSAASRVRLGRLAWIEGRSADAVALSREALRLAQAEGAAGERLAWYHLALAELLAGSGDGAGARLAAGEALVADPGSWQARVMLARLEAASGSFDAAITRLDEAIAVVPRPETLARRADLLTLRAAPGDAERAADDRATIEAIAALAGDDAVYDRTLVLYLADHALEPERAVTLARAELEVRTDVHAHDALAWALFAAGRFEEADAAMRSALVLGTREPRLLYHAGMIAAALGDATRAGPLLADALALDAAFDPLQAGRARAALEVLR